MLDVLMLRHPGPRAIYYFESAGSPAPAPAEPTAAGRGVLRRALEKSYQAVERHLPLDERLCSHLRFHARVALRVPTDCPLDQGRRMFLAFLDNCVKSHRVWLAVDSGLALAGSALVVVPGPNVFFFYPALRALAHHHAQRGGSMHRDGGGLHVDPCPLLDGLTLLDAGRLEERAAQVERKFGFRHFAAFVKKKYGHQ